MTSKDLPRASPPAATSGTSVDRVMGPPGALDARTLRHPRTVSTLVPPMSSKWARRLGGRFLQEDLRSSKEDLRQGLPGSNIGLAFRVQGSGFGVRF